MYPKLLDIFQRQQGIVICADTLRHIIGNMASVKAIIKCSMERRRVAVNPDEISAWFNRISSIVDGIPSEFVFNVDETRCSDHIDSREVRVIASIDYLDPSVLVPYDRHSKRSTFVACITADGFRMKPFPIVPVSRLRKN
jgi:hypothetical protein